MEKAANVFVRNELVPLQKTFFAINDWINEEAIVFQRLYSVKRKRCISNTSPPKNQPRSLTNLLTLRLFISLS